MNTKKLLAVFIPAVLLAGFVLFVQVLRYEPLFPKDTGENKKDFIVPVLTDDPVVGLKRAAKTIVAFEDYSCASCNEFDIVLTQLITKYPTTVKVVWKGLPVTRFPYPSEPAIIYGYCAHKQNKFPEFKALAFSLSDQLSEATLKKIGNDIGLNAPDLETCVASPGAIGHVDQNKAIASLLNIQAVPTFFVNNKQVEVLPTVAAWEQALGLSATSTYEK